MHFVESILIVVAGVFSLAMHDHLMSIAPRFQPVVDGIIIGVDTRLRFDGGSDDRFDDFLLDILHHRSLRQRTEEGHWQARTPAMAAGLANHLFSSLELIRLCPIGLR